MILKRFAVLASNVGVAENVTVVSPPCLTSVRELPALAKLQRELPGLTIVAVSEGRENAADTARFLKKLKTAKNAPTTAAPPAKAFEDVYAKILREHDEILSIHISSKLSQTVAMAERGALPFLGRKRIAVVDSLSASRGLGYLAIAAAEAAPPCFRRGAPAAGTRPGVPADASEIEGR